MTDLFQNRLCGGGPDEGFGAFVRLGDILIDGGNEFRDAAEGAATDALVGDLGKPVLDLVQPGRTGRGKVHLVSGVRRRPFLHFRMFGRPIVLLEQAPKSSAVELCASRRFRGHALAQDWRSFGNGRERVGSSSSLAASRSKDAMTCLSRNRCPSRDSGSNRGALFAAAGASGTSISVKKS